MKKISITLIGLIAMLMLLAVPVYAEKADASKETKSTEKSVMKSSQAPAAKANASKETKKTTDRGAMTSAGQMTRNDAILASSLMDLEVHDVQGDQIGEVADIMIGPDGNVEYIVLSQKDGFLGFGETDLVPVPWSKVNTANIGEDQDAVTLSLSKQELEKAPAFNEEEWQAFLRGEKQQEVRGYFGTEDDARPSGQKY